MITLTVDESAIPAGKVFDKWEVVSGGVTVADGKFTMPESAVEINATYKDAPVIPTEYDITVTGGTASASKATAGTEITLTANAAPEGKAYAEGAFSGFALKRRGGLHTLGGSLTYVWVC